MILEAIVQLNVKFGLDHRQQHEALLCATPSTDF